uniref:Aegyptin/gSG7 salivary protein-like four-helix bundle domain-containing protein n=1 Tax=Anopheles farauti TaxID=69004 RepID=A0A182QJ77_9DIPT
MERKFVHALIALGFICLLQTTPSEASNRHARKLFETIRSIQFDFTKRPVYLHRAKYGLQTQLRNPLVGKVQNLPDSAELSSACLQQMVKKVYDLEKTFYAGFSYYCEGHVQYSIECLEAAEPAYLNGLVALEGETDKCLVTK